MTRKRKKKKKPVIKRYPCDRCGRPTRAVFEGETEEFNSQLDGGLLVTASGYYGGFWDTVSFMGEEPAIFHLCHDCSVWLTNQIPMMQEFAKGGHFSSNVQGEGVLHEQRHNPPERCCEFGSIDHEQGEDPTGAYERPKERVHLEKGSGL